MARRALEIGCAVESWQARGGHVGFLTFTMRHRKGQRLGWLWDRLGRAWSAATSGKGWMTDRERFGVAGWLRVVEVTMGPNGWHVHVHVLVFLEPGLVAPDPVGLHRAMFQRWEGALVRLGAGRPLMKGQDAKTLEGAADSDLARYFTKAVYGARAIGLEFTSAQTKTARSAHGTVPVWSLLDRLVTTGEADALELWHMYEKASKGRRQLTWSQGFRKRLELGEEKSDEDVAGEEMGSALDDLVLITAAGWRVVVGGRHMVDLLEAAESRGLVGARELLDRIGAQCVDLTEAVA